MKRIALGLLVIFVAAPAYNLAPLDARPLQTQPPPPAAITIHVLDGRTGTPMQYRQMDITFYADSKMDSHGAYPVGSIVAERHIRTDPHGAITVVPPSPTEYRIFVTDWPIDTATTAACSQLEFCVKDVLQSGELPPDYCHHPKKGLPASARPGDFYVFLRAVSALESGLAETFFGAPGISRKDTEAIAKNMLALHCPG